MLTAISKIVTARNITIDVGILIAIYFIPALSHLVGVPLYYLDPMRFFLLLGFFLTTNKTNAVILAITIPLFSWLVSGHPVLPKAFLISIELLTNVLLLTYFIKSGKISLLPSLIISIVLSKLIYYLFKFVFIQTGILEMEMIATDLYIQLITLFLLSTVMWFLFRKTVASETLK